MTSDASMPTPTAVPAEAAGRSQPLATVHVASDAGTAAPQVAMTESKYCSGCAARIHKTATQCPHCGAPQGVIHGASGEGHSRIAAALFALLLGGIGVHKFYLGRWGQGLAYLLLCWTMVPAFIALVEGIVYLVMDDAKFAAKYG